VSFDDLDLEQLRLSQNYTDLIAVKKTLLAVPIRKPGKYDFVRTHPEWNFPAPVLKMPGDKRDELYIVTASLVRELADDIIPMTLFATITRQDAFTLWPVRLPSNDRIDEWSRTALAAAMMAQTRWIRVVAKMGVGAYETVEALANLGDPTWPQQPWKELLQLAFKDRVIEDRNHPALRRLRGEDGEN